MKSYRIYFLCCIWIAASFDSPHLMASWTRLNPNIPPNNINDVWGFAPDDVFIAYSNGEIMHWDGVSWEDQRHDSSGEYETINALWGSDPNDVWAVGEIYGTRDVLITHWNGHAWENADQVFEGRIIDIWGFSSDDVIAVGSSSNGECVFRYDGNGWTLQETGLFGSFSCVWGADPDDVFVGKDDAGIIHWNGVEWQNMDCAITRPVDLWGFSGTDVYAASYNGEIWRWDGAIWSQIGDVPGNCMGIWGSAPDALYTVMERASTVTAPIYHYDGISWNKTCYQLSSPRLNAVWGFNSSNVFAVGDNGICLYWDGNGWRNLDNGIRSDLSALKVMNENTLYVAGEFGQVFKWSSDTISIMGRFIPKDTCSFGENGILAVQGSKLIAWDGSEWNLLVDNAGSNFYHVDAATSNSAYLLDVRGGLCFWDGQTLKYIHHFANTGIADMWVAAPDSVYVGGGTDDAGFLLHGHGQTWEPIEIQNLQKVRGIWGTGPDDVFVWCANEQVLHWDGQIWSTMDIGAHVILRDIWGTSENHVYAVGSDGYIGHWNGQTWSVETIPVTETFVSVKGTGPDDILVAGFNGSLVHWNGQDWSDLNTEIDDSLDNVAATSNGDLFVFGMGGTALRRDGSAWRQVFFPYNHNINDIWLYGNKDLYTVGDYASVTHFDGHHWRVICPETSEFGCNLNSIWVSPDNHVFAVGDVMVHYDGETLTQLSVPGEYEQISVWGRSSNDVFSVSAHNTLHWDGYQWQIVDENLDLRRIWGLETGNLYGLYDFGRSVFEWNGTQWSFMSSFSSFGFTCMDLWGSSPDNLFSVASSSAFVHWDGVEWTITDKKMNYSLMRIHGWDENQIHAVGNDGTILRYDYGISLSLQMPATYFNPGDPCWLTADITNPDSVNENALFFIVLDVFGELFFYPSWCHYPDECESLDYEIFDFRTGTTHLMIIPEFRWPDAGNITSDLVFYGAIISSENGALMGNLENWFFRY